MISLLFCLSLSSCLSDALIWTATRSFPQNSWPATLRLNFKPDSAFLIQKTRNPVAVVSIRYGADTNIDQLPLIMETESVGTGEFLTDTLRINLLEISRRTAVNSKIGIFESVDTVPLRGKLAPGWEVTFRPLENTMEPTGLYSFTFQIIDDHEK